jgi:hypothetical protein|tara:strand:- start:131 stop:388 length:258 start_codon:yes stop_codon:yes gene_type:complete
MIRVGKYEFNNEENYLQALNDVDQNKHSVVTLGNIENSDKFHVDVLWQFEDEDETHPDSFSSKVIELENDGIHAFLGVNYLTHRI